MKKNAALIILLFNLFSDQNNTHAQFNQTDKLSQGAKQYLISTRLDFNLIPTFYFNNACIG